MARLVFVVLATAVALFAVAGMASAQGSAPKDTATAAAAAAVPAFGPGAADDQIGNADDGASIHENEATEAPVGGPVPPGAFAATPGESPHSGASAVKVSALVGVVAAATSLFF